MSGNEAGEGTSQLTAAVPSAEISGKKAGEGMSQLTAAVQSAKISGNQAGEGTSQQTAAVQSEEMSGNQACEETAAVNEYAIAEMIPSHVLETVFSYLELKDVINCVLVCSTWESILSNGNIYVWKALCKKKLPPQLWQSDLLENVPTYKTKLRALYHAWNPQDCSRNIHIINNGFTFVRTPRLKSTDAVRSKIGYDYGHHTWELIWKGYLGSSAVVGVSTKRALLHSQNYGALLGSDAHGWGWKVDSDKLIHASRVVRQYPGFRTTQQDQVGGQIRIILDCEKHTLAFQRNNIYIGVAFNGLPKKKLYPTVSNLHGDTEVSLVYLGQPFDD